MMDENLAWDDLHDGVKFRFRDSILLVKNHRGGWIECRSVYPENDFVITVKRNAYEEWQTDLIDAKRRLLSSY
ncbi:hypothetical protein [Thalassoroseus pseudoceratinae]|uniref:hypothetical protein n=1 Tax=Thalassoroseus pseudoceratinae TaxID=2713176 RepID=UPI00141D85C4|nr:hypothetical protein [Thalassoroseus pseudoceratinae]